MAHIIAGYLQQQEQVQEAINQLIGAGFAKKKISAFYVNPAGQHDLYPIGGDQDKSPGAQGAEQIERAEGTISDGNWSDFNPLTPPVLVV